MPERITWEAVKGQGNSLLSPAYKSNGHVFLSGSTGQDPKTGIFPGDVKEQTENVIQGLKRTLEASGSSLDKTLKVLLFISHAADAAAINEVYAKHFTTKPARSALVVGFPNPKIKVEIEVVAEYKEIKSKL
ncbi:hypothetical protein BN7_132 [Wickerhamomyces ciferrii]|uniref:Uncharacterized protein n=1 Tax=Wickerhamomyces ciferrii (strain ATCC 14091 / BCRC 22168 / CBS 111 / JCM 3599 / NBRC 0793 / NRRL Y-1031 F-60-10) TaxID=1206466 RepID=K0KGQ7_WICCF|nr:uncharacterized protein BN7_132 [Wickerhamomyces ciferrii]CCH40599.1 hypothetical protein BN7_132 [Wickerhamomyces ciferrii]